MSKQLTQKQFSTLGGKAKYKKYGKSIYSEMGKKSAAKRLAQDPDYFKNLAQKAREAREQKKLKKLQEQPLPVSSKPEEITTPFSSDGNQALQEAKEIKKPSFFSNLFKGKEQS